MQLLNIIKRLIIILPCLAFIANATENNAKIPQNDVRHLKKMNQTNYITENGSYQAMQKNLNKVYFDFDKSTIKVNFAKILDQHAKFLLSHPSFNVMIEGHADERGSSTYNFGLGEKRAQAVKDYLILKGVSPNQLYTVSYGKERPVSTGDHVKNRRSVIIY